MGYPFMAFATCVGRSKSQREAEDNGEVAQIEKEDESGEAVAEVNVILEFVDR